jgi:hypothetical protein
LPRTEQFEHGWAVVRVDEFQFGDPMPDDWGDYVKVKEIWRTLEDAQSEVDRLNALDEELEGGRSRYHCQSARVRRRDD